MIKLLCPIEQQNGDTVDDRLQQIHIHEEDEISFSSERKSRRFPNAPKGHSAAFAGLSKLRMFRFVDWLISEPSAAVKFGAAAIFIASGAAIVYRKIAEK